MQSKPPSVGGRVLLAVLLTIGFYSLALGVAGLLVFIVYAEFALVHRVNFQITLVCLVGAGTILWSILPRLGHFVDPGPRLDAEKQPNLFAEIQQISRATGQKMPAQVYLIGDVNAFVAEVGGFLGIGRRRVMGIGLPLLSALTVSQLRAVMAHEFGHYFTGDTRLGPMIYQIRTTIIRTIQHLGGRSWLQAPFVWYGQLFLRITHAVSRRQEFAADELSARLVGARAAIEGLRAIHGVVAAFPAYIQNEVFPIFLAGYYPPLSEGFSQFIGVERIAVSMERLVEDILENEKPDPYRTHPALKQRISALEALPAQTVVRNDRPAFSLLANDVDLERQLMNFMFDREKICDLKPVAWQEVGAVVYIPAWRNVAKQYQASLTGLTPANLPEFGLSPDRLIEQIKQSSPRPQTAEELSNHVQYVVGAALGVALIDSGWELSAGVGEDFHLKCEDVDVQPFALVKKLRADAAAAESWRLICKQTGIADLDLAAAFA